MKKIFTILLTFSILQACDCMQFAAGTVIDKQTKQPISGVKIYKQGTESNNTKTNEKGEFKIESISGGLFRCPPMKIVVKKEGYETVQQKGGGKIELKKK